MSYVVANPGTLAETAAELHRIGSMISMADAVAAGQTTEVETAAADEVSAAIASVFSRHAQAYQALSARAGTFHEQFVQALNGAEASYATA